MQSPISLSFRAVLVARGTRGDPARTDGHPVREATALELPDAIRELLQVQDGEDPIKAYALGYRFISECEIASVLENLREMVEADGTLPPCFLEFIPFLRTDCKTDVGIFTLDSSFKPGEVVEYHYESGEFVSWAPSIASFLSLLVTPDGQPLPFGLEFPPVGRLSVDLASVLPWQPD